MEGAKGRPYLDRYLPSQRQRCFCAVAVAPKTSTQPLKFVCYVIILVLVCCVCFDILSSHHHCNKLIHFHLTLVTIMSEQV